MKGMEKIKEYFKNKDNLIAIGIILFYCFISFGFSRILGLIYKGIFSDEFIISHLNGLDMSINIICYLLLFAGIMPFSIKGIKEDWFESRKDTLPIARQIIIGIILIYAASFLGNLISTAITDQTSSNQDGLDTILTDSKLFYWLMFPIVGIIGPVIEELVFRRSFFKLIKNDIIAIIISSLCFCLIHMTNQDGNVKDFIGIAIVYALPGVALSFTYVKSKHNILIPMFCHIFNNILSLFIVGLL